MAKDTFGEGWLPTIGHSVAYKPNVNPIKFGDNYEVRVPSGINNRPEIWSVSFTYNYATTAEILAFLASQNAYKSFFWRSPHNQTITVVCRDWSVSTDEGVKTITAKFEQVFEN